MRARTSGGVGLRMMAALSGGLAEGIGFALPRKFCRGPLLRKLCFGYSVWVHGIDFVEAFYSGTFISSKSTLRRDTLSVLFMAPISSRFVALEAPEEQGTVGLTDL